MSARGVIHKKKTKGSVRRGRSSRAHDSNDESRPFSNAGKKDDEGIHKESGIDDQKRPENSSQDVNTAGPSINTASTNVNTEDTQKVIQALKDLRWIEAIQEEHLQFKLQQVWTLVDLPHGKRAIGTKWVYKNKKYKRDIVIRNKARLVVQGYTQEEGIDYDESAFLYCELKEEVYVCQPLGFEDPEFPDRVYKVEKKDDGIFISQDKYVNEILKKFGFLTVKTASTPMETLKPLMKDENAKDVDIHLYRSMIGSLMYLTSLRLDIMFVVCAYARFQVTPKVSHLHVVKRIFRYLKGQPKLGLRYLKDLPFDLELKYDSAMLVQSIDRNPHRRLSISWKQIDFMAMQEANCNYTPTTEAEYVVVASYYRQVLWIQNQMLDYGYNDFH
ncbi:putative ribonuclease H-like domain-containing protein [Tanacetum coccineum]